MLAAVPDKAIRDMQDAIQVHGKTVTYTEAGATSGRNVQARVVYLASTELQNSIETYPIRVTLDARDFTARAPAKGDTVTLDGARRAVMQVGETHVGNSLVAYRCGVQG